MLLRCFVRKTVRTLNFDNPVYRKTTEDQVSLEKNQYQPTRSLPSVSTSPSEVASFHEAVDLVLLNVGVSRDVTTLAQ